MTEIPNRQFNVVGVMSGTSCDGLDIASCSFKYNKGVWSYRIESATTINYPEYILKMLKKAYLGKASSLIEIDRAFGHYIGEEVKSFVNKLNHKVELIGSHGHTIFHQPQKGYTSQIGLGAEIAGVTGITTVCDFRTVDIALGGQGAPLVPIGDKFLFGEYDACVNLGGFSNISYRSNRKRIAFDICPVNIVLNLLAYELGFSFDQGGAIARQGKLSMDLLNKLNAIEYYSVEGSKSLGIEWVEKEILPVLKTSGLSPTDQLRTVVEHIAVQITDTLTSNSLGSVLFSGGGVFNSFLMERISALSSAEIHIPDNEVINYKEALIFAFLALLRKFEQVNCLASVTGASRDSIVGAVYMS